MSVDSECPQALKVLVEQWLAWDKNETTRKVIADLWDAKNFQELERRLSTRMQFGTAGLRAEMGAGYCMMNDVTIIQTTQGFAAYMLQSTPTVKERGVVIGYDARHNSNRFAKLSAAVLVNLGIKVYLFSRITPTPYVPYGVLKYSADWGIMVTASHNPKQDNGYKVYFQNGAQIISPHDKLISTSILHNLVPLDSSWDVDSVSTSSLVSDPYHEVNEAYMKDLCKLSYSKDTNSTSPVKFTYTAMHGVGYESIKSAVKTFNFEPFIPVNEQVEPDPEFPTVEYPNPEEGKEALNLAIKTANAHGSTVILANDPDADRLGIAEKQPSGSWLVLTGDQIGSLLCWWMIFLSKIHHPNVAVSDMYCIASAVSSKMLRTICHKEGVNYVETLTGFKWMGNKAIELMNKGKTVIFAFEESIGFMCGTTVLDKDGVSAAMVAAEMITYLANQGLSVKGQVDKLYDDYGYHVSNNSYFISHNPANTKRMFDRLRNHENSNTYPSHCGCFKIKHIRDLTTGYDSCQPDNAAVLPVSSSSQMLTFYFENGSEITLRTSGTEPKIKYYAEMCPASDSQLSRDELTHELESLVDEIIERFFEPEKNGLIAKKS